MARQFQAHDAATAALRPVPLSVAITGIQGSGKTVGALDLARGFERVIGSPTYVIDTEGNRALHYAGNRSRFGFQFQHVPLPPPHNPGSFEEAIRFCLSKGAKVIVIESLSDEHSGEGGVLDMVDNFLERKAGEDEERRAKLKWAAQIEPKRERHKLNRLIKDCTDAYFILTYRATDKTKPGAGGKPVHIGWQSDTTSLLPYYTTVRFLLLPGSDGHPILNPETPGEKLAVKTPEYFRAWFKDGFQLNADLGERMARWAAGDAPAPASAPSGGQSVPEPVSAADRALAAVKARFPGRHESDARRKALAAYWNVDTPEVLRALPAERLAEGMAAFEKRQPLDEYLDELDAIRQMEEDRYRQEQAGGSES